MGLYSFLKLINNTVYMITLLPILNEVNKKIKAILLNNNMVVPKGGIEPPTRGFSVL